MSRVTRADLDAAVTQVNDKLGRMGSPYTYEASSRNGYTGVDLFKMGRCLHVIATGTAKECIGGLYSDAFDKLNDAAHDRIVKESGIITPDQLASKGHL